MTATFSIDPRELVGQHLGSAYRLQLVTSGPADRVAEAGAAHLAPVFARVRADLGQSSAVAAYRAAAAAVLDAERRLGDLDARRADLERQTAQPASADDALRLRRQAAGLEADRVAVAEALPRLRDAAARARRAAETDFERVAVGALEAVTVPLVEAREAAARQLGAAAADGLTALAGAQYALDTLRRPAGFIDLLRAEIEPRG